MVNTTKYGFRKPELGDAANITEMNQNWDTVESKLSDIESELDVVDSALYGIDAEIDEINRKLGQTGTVDASLITGAVAIENGGTGATTASGALTNLGAQAQHIARTVSITTASWADTTATVSVNGVSASNTVLVAPAPNSQLIYAECGVYCSAQGGNSLTFTCTTTPASALSVNVVILN